ncbi:hypothetical protein [Streptomyces mirabilis]|uniref:hypothetical protein n=1 Tax=Streptomyces mirabilis TaxID=68239 RepID=UPI002E27EA6E|nr:hypothetical protein [Streptomyces mirabilis]
MLGKEVPCRRGYRPGDDCCDHGHMDAYRDAQCGHQHTDRGTGDCTEAERGEEARHDGTAELPFDRRSVHGHRDVPETRSRAEQEQPGHQQGC